MCTSGAVGEAIGREVARGMCNNVHAARWIALYDGVFLVPSAL